MEEPSLLQGGLSDADAQEALVLLAALGVQAEVEREPSGASALFVAAADLPRALAILAEAAADPEVETRRRHAGASRDGSVATVWRWWGPHALPVSAMILACVAAFLWTTGGALEASYARMVERGAVSAARVEAGEAWRLVAAMFLHFDLAHLLANMGTLLLVGPILARSIGGGRFLVVFVGAGIAGNIASYVFAPSPSLKAGASGAVAGVIGGLAGQALRAGREGRFRRWQVVGAAAAVYALLIGAGPSSDHVAHLGGFVAGVAIGRWVAPVHAVVDAGAELAGRGEAT